MVLVCICCKRCNCLVLLIPILKPLDTHPKTTWSHALYMPSRTASLIRSIAQLLSQLHQCLTRRIASAPLVYNRLHLVHGLAYFVAQVRAKPARLELRPYRVAPAYSNRVALNHFGPRSAFLAMARLRAYCTMPTHNKFALDTTYLALWSYFHSCRSTETWRRVPHDLSQGADL